MNQKEIIVFFYYIKYEVYSILHVIEATFKLFHLFNLQYPSVSYSKVIYSKTFFLHKHAKVDVACLG